MRWRRRRKSLSNSIEDTICVTFSPDGKTLASGDGRLVENEVIQWDVSTCRKLHVFKGHNDAVSSISFVNDRTLVSGTNPMVFVWDLAAKKKQRGISVVGLEGHSPTRAVQASPDGKQVAVGFTDGEVKVFAVASGRCLLRLKGHRDTVPGAGCVRFFSPDGAQALMNLHAFFDSVRGNCVPSQTPADSAQGSLVAERSDEMAFTSTIAVLL
jgi:WD40 repeat protein